MALYIFVAGHIYVPAQIGAFFKCMLYKFDTGFDLVHYFDGDMLMILLALH